MLDLDVMKRLQARADSLALAEVFRLLYRPLFHQANNQILVNVHFYPYAKKPTKQHPNRRINKRRALVKRLKAEREHDAQAELPENNE